MKLYIDSDLLGEEKRSSKNNIHFLFRTKIEMHNLLKTMHFHRANKQIKIIRINLCQGEMGKIEQCL